MALTGHNWLGQITRTQGGATITLADTLSYTGSAGAAGAITGMRIGDNTFAYAASYDAAQRLSAITLTRVSTGATLYRTAPTFDASRQRGAGGHHAHNRDGQPGLLL